MLDAIIKGHDEIKKIVAFINDIKSQIGKKKMCIRDRVYGIRRGYNGLINGDVIEMNERKIGRAHVWTPVTL